MKHTHHRPDARGFTLVELAIVVIVLGVLMSIAVAAVFRARVAANEGSAVAGLRSVNTAQFQYQASCGGGLYASTLLVLGRPPVGVNEAFLPGTLGSAVAPQHNGYEFTMAAGQGGGIAGMDCNGEMTLTRYYAAAEPAEPDEGNRSFATNQAGVLWETLSQTAPVEPFGPPAGIVD